MPSKIFVVTVISSGGPLLGRSREIFPLGGKYTALSRDDKIARNKLHKPRWVTPAGFAVGSGGGAVPASLLDLEGVGVTARGRPQRGSRSVSPSAQALDGRYCQRRAAFVRSREILPVRR